MKVIRISDSKTIEKYTVPSGSWVQTENLGAQHVPGVMPTGLLFSHGAQLNANLRWEPKIHVASKDFVILYEPIDPPQLPANATKMLPSVRMVNFVEFHSSSGVTKEQVDFWRAFRLDMKRLLKGRIKRLELNRNHFEMNGFFETNSGAIYYISTGDLRWFAKKCGMLIRTAKDFKDFTGGSNCTIMFDEHFEENLLKYASK